VAVGSRGDLLFDNREWKMMPMQNGATAWEKDPHRQMRSFVIRVFLCGFMLGAGFGEIRMNHFRVIWDEMQNPNRWWGVGFAVLAAVLGAWGALDYYRKKIA
jgi:hypothetical protein